MLTPKSPSQNLLSHLIHPTLLGAPSYKIDSTKVEHKIDQNEAPLDWPAEYKEKVLDILRKKQWNRYPTAQSPKETAMIAEMQGVPEECVLTQSGSDSLLTVILRAFSLHENTQFVLAEPSFPVVAMQAETHNIDFQIWPLTEDFQYDANLLPDLQKRSVVFFASPNNPTGSILSQETLKGFLKKHPETMWVADEAYVEFHDNGYQELMAEFSNLILVRTFSKAWAAAGTRLGYIIAAKEWIDEFKKFRLAYSLNHFNAATVEVIATDKSLQTHMKNKLKEIVSEKERLFQKITQAKSSLFKIFPSYANFFLLQFNEQEKCDQFYKFLIQNNMIIRNVSKAPKLGRCLRVTVGTKEQNELFVQLVKNFKA